MKKKKKQNKTTWLTEQPHQKCPALFTPAENIRLLERIQESRGRFLLWIFSEGRNKTERMKSQHSAEL